MWDRHTGEPIDNAIVWQDTRTDEICDELSADGGQDRFRERTGLPIAPYFSATKVRWMLDHVPAHVSGPRPASCFRNIDTWCIWHSPVGRGGEHITDVTNASRTLLMDLETLDWDPELLRTIGIPRDAAGDPPVERGVRRGGVGALAGVPIAGASATSRRPPSGRRASARRGQEHLRDRQLPPPQHGQQAVQSRHGLITTVGYQIGDAPPVYCLEGSIAITGALVQWLRDNLGLITGSGEVETLAATVEDNGGCYFVPAFSGSSRRTGARRRAA